MNFLVVTLKINGKKVMAVINNIKYFIPLNDKDGYGYPQKGCKIHFVDGSELTVNETLEDIFEYLKKPIV